MNEQSLYEKQQAVKAAFDAKAVEKTQKDAENDDIVLEMNRLQGEYRLLDSLREEMKEMRKDMQNTPGTPKQFHDPAAVLPPDPLNRPKKEAKNGTK